MQRYLLFFFSGVKPPWKCVCSKSDVNSLISLTNGSSCKSVISASSSSRITDTRSSSSSSSSSSLSFSVSSSSSAAFSHRGKSFLFTAYKLLLYLFCVSYLFSIFLLMRLCYDLPFSFWLTCVSTICDPPISQASPAALMEFIFSRNSPPKVLLPIASLIIAASLVAGFYRLPRKGKIATKLGFFIHRALTQSNNNVSSVVVPPPRDKETFSPCFSAKRVQLRPLCIISPSPVKEICQQLSPSSLPSSSSSSSLSSSSSRARPLFSFFRLTPNRLLCLLCVMSVSVPVPPPRSSSLPSVLHVGAHQQYTYGYTEHEAEAYSAAATAETATPLWLRLGATALTGQSQVLPHTLEARENTGGSKKAAMAAIATQVGREADKKIKSFPAYHFSGPEARRLAADRHSVDMSDSRQRMTAPTLDPDLFSMRSLFPFFTNPFSTSPRSATGNKDRNAAAADGGNREKNSSVSSSTVSGLATTSFSSMQSSSGATRKQGIGGQNGRKEKREGTGADNMSEAMTEEEDGIGGSARSSNNNTAGGGGGVGGGGSGGGGGITPEGSSILPRKVASEKLEASLTNVNMLLLALCLLCCLTLGYFIHVNLIPHLPDSAAAMLTGVVFGLVARIWGASPSENSFLHFDPEFFYFVLLPPIVLEAGFCLNKAAFLYNLGPILLLSILGTLLSTVIIAKVTLHTAHLCGLEGPPHELRGFSWVFASLISATDTVATLSIIGSPKFRLDEKGVDLYSILMGESVLNDAVSIALTRSCLRLFFTAEAEAAQRASGLDVIVDFLAVVVGSLVLGIGMGGICCFCFRHSKLRKLPEYEVAITLLTAYMAFGVSECIGFSGVVSLFFCGVMLGHFNVHNMSAKSRNSIDTVFKTIALLSEKTVFAYLGVVAAVGVGQRTFNIFFVLVALCACALSRAACVFPMSFISNRFRRKDEKIDWRQQILIWLAGLRGAVAFALAMTIPCSLDFWRAVCRHNKELVVTTTLVLVAITTLGVGSMLEYTAVKLGVVRPRRHSLPMQGYGVGDAPSSTSSSSALLPLEHRQQQEEEEALCEEENSGDTRSFINKHHTVVPLAQGIEERKRSADGGEEEGRGSMSREYLLGTKASPPPSGSIRNGEDRSTVEGLLHTRRTSGGRSEIASQEMVTASKLVRGPSPSTAPVTPSQQQSKQQQQQQRQQQRQAEEKTTSERHQQHVQPQGRPSSLSENLWSAHGVGTAYVSTGDETTDTEDDTATAEALHQRTRYGSNLKTHLMTTHFHS